MNKWKIKTPGVGFWLLVAALLLSIAAFVLYAMTYSALHYGDNLWVIAMMILALWSMVCLLVNSLFAGETFVLDFFFVIAAFALTIAALQFFTPCLSPIGIYFTVHNMGDVEANAIGVPRAIAGIILFVLAIVCVVASSFFTLARKRKEVHNEEI